MKYSDKKIPKKASNSKKKEEASSSDDEEKEKKEKGSITSSYSSSNYDDTEESEDEKILKESNIRIGATDSGSRIFISGLEHYDYEEIKESLKREIQAWHKNYSMGFVFSGCKFNLKTLKALKKDLSKYKKDYTRSLFQNCYYEKSKNKPLELKGSKFFSRKIGFKDINSK